MDETPPRGVIVVDLDGTICEHRYPAFGEPIAGVQEALKRLKQAGYRIIIHTWRTSSYHSTTGVYDPEVNSSQAVRIYLERYNIPFDEIWMHDKPLAMVYIDDRGMRLVGDCHQSNWSDIVEELLSGDTRPKAPRTWRWWR